MKGRLVVAAIVGAVIIGVLVVSGVIGGQEVQILARYEKIDCAEKKYFMTVISVSDTAFLDLIGKTVSPEIFFKQTKLNQYIQSNLSEQSEEFHFIGYLRSTSVKHCANAECFRVRKIKKKEENTFTEF